MRDYFAEELGGAPSGERDYFTEELIKNKPDKAENILQKTAKVINQNMGMGTLGFADPLGPVKTGYGVRDVIIDETVQNPLANFAVKVGTDPVAYGLQNPIKAIGGGMMKAGGAIKGGVENLANPSKVFGRKIGELQKSNPDKRVNFIDIISRASSDPKASKVLEKSGVLQKYGGTTMKEGGAVSDNLSNLTLQDSQDLVNMVKDGVRQAVKEGTVKSSELGIAKMFSELSKAQKSAFKGFDKVARNYGVSKKVSKLSSKYGKKALAGAATGAGLGIAGGLAWDSFHK